MKIFYSATIFIASTLSTPKIVSGQCNSSSGSGQGSITPATTWQTLSGADAGEYWTFTASPCSTYSFTFCSNGGSALWDTQITITDNSGNPVSGGYNDDYCSLQSFLSWTPTSSGTFRVYITLYNCQSTGATGATLAYALSSTNTVSGYFSIVDDATASSNCATLTTATNNQRGCAWSNNSTLNFASNFTWDFTVNLGSSDGGADGIAFVMQNDPRGKCACGTAGEAVGSGSITNSIIIEIDTYLNTNDREDGMPTVLCSSGSEPDHLDIWLNGNVNPSGSCPSPAGARVIPNAIELKNGASAYNIENGLDHVLRVSWATGSPGTLTATLYNSAITVSYGSVSYSFNPMTVFGTNTPYFGFTGSTGGLNNQQYACFPLAVLPVELISFEGKCMDEKINLRWKTASETNNDFFIIQRSTDKESLNWEIIGTVEGAGNSSETRAYEFSEGNPSETSQTTFYRIIQQDFNGSLNYFPPVSVSLCNALRYSVFPSPFIDHFTLSYRSEDAPLAVKIVDMMGREIQFSSDDKNIQEAVSREIYFKNAVSGIYFLQLTCNDKTITKKLISK